MQVVRKNIYAKSWNLPRRRKAQQGERSSEMPVLQGLYANMGWQMTVRKFMHEDEFWYKALDIKRERATKIEDDVATRMCKETVFSRVLFEIDADYKENEKILALTFAGAMYSTQHVFFSMALRNLLNKKMEDIFGGSGEKVLIGESDDKSDR